MMDTAAMVHRPALHAASIASFTYSFWLLTQLTNKADDAFGWHFIYLTILGLGLSLLVFALALVHDMTLISAVDRIKRAVLVLAFPLEALISLLYWGIVLYDDSLMHGEGQERLPFLQDAGYHLLPVLALWCELLVYSSNFKRSIKHAQAIIGFAVLYGAWLQVCYHQNGFWLETIVTLLYFAMMTIDQGLLFDDRDTTIPPLIDAGIHLLPTALLWLELLVFTPAFHYAIGHIVLIMAFSMGYSGWIELCFQRNAFWPYPFLSELDSFQRLAFYGIICALAIGIYRCGKCWHCASQYVTH
ncbi:FAR-17a/AIG1-like protein [Thamnocephalis sphaerospora]|uniref:FAR-17a/AIG1-like protein n=1 Tax=Thamnocephalis sphaerospora TaxID=78915 RepID=A0A4P9XW24_9FUNG|nr:FAR-17a/AIG1-like protein [Thamnocephalis sphaerospora]|eukprot:RKP10242.1 FAR-17a/AIG1-like protein [Thamnocephalis sphaerospora]